LILLISVKKQKATYFDFDKTGKYDINKFVNMYSCFFNPDPDELIKIVFLTFDQNMNGLLNISEFEAAVFSELLKLPRRPETKEIALRKFAQHDKYKRNQLNLQGFVF